MYEFELIKQYFSKISKNNKAALNLNDDVFSAPLLMVKETGTVFLNTLMDKLNKKKKTIKNKKNRKK